MLNHPNPQDVANVKINSSEDIPAKAEAMEEELDDGGTCCGGNLKVQKIDIDVGQADVDQSPIPSIEDFIRQHSSGVLNIPRTFQLENEIQTPMVSVNHANDKSNNIPIATITQERTSTEVDMNPIQSYHSAPTLTNQKVEVPRMCPICRAFGSVRPGNSINELPLVTPCEVRTHCLPEDCWITGKGYAYNITDFLDVHPGGKRCLLRRVRDGVDCSEDYTFHSKLGRKQWHSMRVGKLTSCEKARQEGDCIIL